MAKRKTAPVAAGAKAPGEPKPPDTLNPNQVDFCHLYVKQRNAGKSYAEAYGHEGNDASCCAAGSRLLRNVNVSKYIDELLAIKRATFKVDRNDLLDKLADIAFDEGNKKQVEAIDGLWTKLGLQKTSDPGTGQATIADLLAHAQTLLGDKTK